MVPPALRHEALFRTGPISHRKGMTHLCKVSQLVLQAVFGKFKSDAQDLERALTPKRV